MRDARSKSYPCFSHPRLYLYIALCMHRNSPHRPMLMPGSQSHASNIHTPCSHFQLHHHPVPRPLSLQTTEASAATPHRAEALESFDKYRLQERLATQPRRALSSKRQGRKRGRLGEKKLCASVLASKLNLGVARLDLGVQGCSMWERILRMRVCDTKGMGF